MSQNYIGPARKFYSRAAHYEGDSWTSVCEVVRRNIIGIICDKVTYWRGSTYALSGELSEFVEDLHEAMIAWGRNHTRQVGGGTVICGPRETFPEEIALSEEGLVFRAWYLERLEQIFRGEKVEQLPPSLVGFLAGYGVQEDNLCGWRGSAGYSLAGEGLDALPVSSRTLSQEAVNVNASVQCSQGNGGGFEGMGAAEESSISDWLGDAGWLAEAVKGFVAR
jgi:hypothetical protein